MCGPYQEGRGEEVEDRSASGVLGERGEVWGC